MKYWFYLDEDGKTREVEDIEEAIEHFRKAVADGKNYGCVEFMRGAGT